MRYPDKFTHDFTFEGLRRYSEDVGRCLGAISFGDGTNKDSGQNIEGNFVSGTLNVHDAEQGFKHGLGRVPVGFIVIGLNKASIVYDGATANTKDTVYLRASVDATNFKIFLI